MDNKEKVLDILSTIFGKEVDENCSRENEGLWDSITHLEIVVTLEEEFGVRIPQDKIPEITSVKSILDVLKNL